MNNDLIGKEVKVSKNGITWYRYVFKEDNDERDLFKDIDNQ